MTSSSHHFQNSPSIKKFNSISSLESSSSLDESYNQTDYGLESPTIVSHLIETVRKESKIMTLELQNSEIPPPLGFEEFQTLSSTKQNIELFKILSAIADEIEVLRKSTEQRICALESIISNKNIYGLIPSVPNGKSRSDSSSTQLVQRDESGENGSSGTTTRPASWPKEPHRSESRDVELMIARNAAEDRPVLLNIGGKRFEVRIHFHDFCFDTAESGSSSGLLSHGFCFDPK